MHTMHNCLNRWPGTEPLKIMMEDAWKAFCRIKKIRISATEHRPLTPPYVDGTIAVAEAVYERLQDSLPGFGVVVDGGESR